MEEVKQEFKIDHLKTAMRFAGSYANNVKTVEEHCFNSEPYRYCITDLYYRFVKYEGLTPIEKLSNDDKQLFFSTSENVFPKKVPKLHRKELCIFLYFMNFMFEKYFIA